MGIVIRQSAKNIIITYFGFLIGAVNTLFLYTAFMSKEQYGLVSYMLSVGNILTPFLTFGVGNTFIKFYFSYSDEKQRHRFVMFMFWLPLLMIFTATLLTWASFSTLQQWLSRENPVVGEYLWSILGLSVVIAYFEVFYAWARVHLRSVEGNFLKEVFPRVCILVLLLMLHFGFIQFDTHFIGLLIGIYTLRMLLMGYIALKIHTPTLTLKLPKNYRQTLTYGSFLLIAGSVSTLLVDIDKFMLNQYLPLDQIAIYSVAVFIATTIAVPYRSVYQIVSPMVSKLMNEKNHSELHKIYHSGTLNLFLIGSFIFALILLNIDDIYALIPKAGYDTAKQVLILLSVVKLFDTLTGMSNAILLNAWYYRIVLYLGLFLVFCMIALNAILIPKWGINGAAIATFLAFCAYNILKMYFVYRYEKLQPFSKKIAKISFFICLLMIVFYILKFPFSPFTNIIIRSGLIIMIFISFGLYFRFSKELTNATIHLLTYFQRKNNPTLQKITSYLIQRIKK